MQEVIYVPGVLDQEVTAESKAFVVGKGNEIVLNEGLENEQKVETSNLIVFTPNAQIVSRLHVPAEQHKIGEHPYFKIEVPANDTVTQQNAPQDGAQNAAQS